MTLRIERDPFVEIIDFGDIKPEPPVLSEEEKYYVQKLSSLPLNSIIDGAQNQAMCHAIGQEIYQQYKEADPMNIYAGKEAVQKIYEAIGYNCQDGFLRKQYIKMAWERIGDNVWRWGI